MFIAKVVEKIEENKTKKVTTTMLIMDDNFKKLYKKVYSIARCKYNKKTDVVIAIYDNATVQEVYNDDIMKGPIKAKYHIYTNKEISLLNFSTEKGYLINKSKWKNCFWSYFYTDGCVYIKAADRCSFYEIAKYHPESKIIEYTNEEAKKDAFVQSYVLKICKCLGH